MKDTYLLLYYTWNFVDLKLWVKKRIIIVIMVEIQSCNLGLDPRPVYGLTKVTGVNLNRLVWAPEGGVLT